MGSSTSSAFIRAAQIPMTLLATIGLDGTLFPQQAILKDNSTYDYIVVGIGTAGCVVTRRLAEDRNNTVLAIEAGDDPPITALLAATFSLLPASYVDYNYTSTYDDYAARGQNNFTMLTAGKMLGGTASMSHFLHTRGVARDYDCWAKLSKDNSWKYENVLPYFIKSERMDDMEIISNYPEFHGTEGPIGITRQLDHTVVNYLNSFAEVGNPTVLDLNADVNVGVSQAQLTLADRKRQTPALSYLKPVKDYPNLYVSKNTRVTRIIFENNVAVGVEAVHKGKTYTFKANKEIIISAGVYNTPQLLMLSGIGPKQHLESFKIDVLRDLPVGSNLVDQVTVTLVHKVKKYLLPIPEPQSLLPDLTKIPFSILVGSVALNKSQTYPDYQTYNLLLQHDTPFLTVTCNTVFGLRSAICDRWQKQVISRDSFYTILVHLQPKSRGTVRLKSIDPFDDPRIKTGYFTKIEDLKDMLKFVRDFIRVGDTEYFKEIGAGLVGLDLPECAGKERGSDEFWICYILNHAGSPYHTVGTCPMGKVVDGNLKVKGIEKLRIVDASVMPKIPRGAPMATVVMLAEKASDMIKNDNKNI